MKFCLTFSYKLILFLNCHSQSFDTIKFINPSFEDIPQCCKAPEGWNDCGKVENTPPDIHPTLDRLNGQPLFGVTQGPLEGNTYLGLAVRNRDSYEHISQRLNKPLLKNRCYTFSIFLCRSAIYWSGYNNVSGVAYDFTKPVHFRVWAGNSVMCSRKQLLVASGPIRNTEWKEYEFEFKAEADFKYFQLEAYYNSINYDYHGNLLLDNLSDLIEIDCSFLED